MKGADHRFASVDRMLCHPGCGQYWQSGSLTPRFMAYLQTAKGFTTWPTVVRQSTRSHWTVWDPPYLGSGGIPILPGEYIAPQVPILPKSGIPPVYRMGKGNQFPLDRWRYAGSTTSKAGANTSIHFAHLCSKCRHGEHSAVECMKRHHLGYR